MLMLILLVVVAAFLGYWLGKRAKNSEPDLNL